MEVSCRKLRERPKPNYKEPAVNDIDYKGILEPKVKPKFKPKPKSKPKPPDEDLVASTSSKRFSLHRELGSKIKTSLNSERKDSPVVKIDMPFDQIEFNGGLRLCGTRKRFVRGVQRYTITEYQDLNQFLGANWHYRGLNSNGDFCFAVKENGGVLFVSQATCKRMCTK